MRRREFVRSAAVGAAQAAVLGGASWRALAAQERPPVRVGMCDWSLGRTADVGAIAVAKEIGLDGVEVSVGYPGDGLRMRQPALQAEYLAAARDAGLALPSVALGVLNEVPLKSEPVAGVWLADAIQVAHALGAHTILIAFFGRGTLDMANDEDVQRTVTVLKDLAPRAAEAGVTLGLENTLSAEDNLRLLEMVGADAVRVYYDFKNSANAGRDPAAEIRRLGSAICQVHAKNDDRMLRDRTNVDFAACAEALREVGYSGWVVLETSSPTDLVADTKANLEYVRATF